MCGIVGVAGKVTTAEEKAFGLLLQLDTIRGPHSTGVVAVDTSGEATVVKKLGTPWDLYDSYLYQDAMRPALTCLMGHNRWATKGKITARNAHPFEFDSVIGMHNGTLVSQWGLDDSSRFEVDSENIYYHMDRNGVEDTIKKTNGAFALVWWDKAEKSVNFIRNHQRPLYYVFSEDNKTFFWASEDWMLEVALGRAGIKHKLICEATELHHYRIPLAQEAPYKMPVIEQVAIRKLEPYRSPVVVTRPPAVVVTKPTNVTEIGTAKKKIVKGFSEHSKLLRTDVEFYVDSEGVSASGQHFIQCYAIDDDEISIRLFPEHKGRMWTIIMESPNFWKATARSYTSIEQGYLTVDMSSLDEVSKDSSYADDGVPMYKVHGGVEVNATGYAEAVKHGCAWCSSAVDTKEADELIWLDGSTFVCNACQDFDDVKTYLLQTTH